MDELQQESEGETIDPSAQLNYMPPFDGDVPMLTHHLAQIVNRV